MALMQIKRHSWRSTCRCLGADSNFAIDSYGQIQNGCNDER